MKGILPSATGVNLKNYSFYKFTFPISFVLQKKKKKLGEGGLVVSAQLKAEGIWVNKVLSVIAVRPTPG